MRGWVNQVKQQERAAHAVISRELAVTAATNSTLRELEALLRHLQAVEALGDDRQRRTVRDIAGECQRLLETSEARPVADQTRRRRGDGALRTSKAI